jgi:formylglycine-generating enzyme required for sulfatase activity
MAGNVFQWVEDCAHDAYEGAPRDGSAWIAGGDCSKRQARGGSWADLSRFIRSAARQELEIGMRSRVLGFRVARTLER